jgi:hypothetical protein
MCDSNQNGSQSCIHFQLMFLEFIDKPHFLLSQSKRRLSNVNKEKKMIIFVGTHSSDLRLLKFRILVRMSHFIEQNKKEMSTETSHFVSKVLHNKEKKFVASDLR